MLFRESLIGRSVVRIVFALIVILAFSLNLVVGQQVCTPEGNFGYEHTGSGSVSQFISVSWVDVSRKKDTTGYIPAGMAIVSGTGELVWYSSQAGWFQVNDFRYSPRGNTWSFIRLAGPDSMQYHILDNSLSTAGMLLPGQGLLPDAHEFCQFSDTTWLLSARKDSVFPPSPSIPEGSSVRCFILEEKDLTGNTRWVWNSCDHLDPGEGFSFYEKSPSILDYCHGNAAWRVNDSLIIVSMRNMNAIAGIRYPEGTVNWQLGGKHSGFRFVSDSGFSGQHDCRMLDDSTICLLDNGNMSASGLSRVVIYRLNFTARTATLLREIPTHPPVFIEGMGSQDWAGDTLLINFGRVFRPAPTLQLVADGKILRTWFFPDSVQVYRAHFCSPSAVPMRPVISVKYVSGKYILSTGRHHREVRWNTGEQRHKILARPGEMYQVWVPCGIGMLGSVPVVCPELPVQSPKKHRTGN